jgi:NAD(P)-dependent dehydrogenase (short-subunit alcohol dehydrogenase family)
MSGEAAEQSLAGRTAVITGAGSGMGREVALAYAAVGASVVLCSNAPTQIEAVQRECASLGAAAFAIPVDVSSERAVTQLFADLATQVGDFHILVNAAGIDVGGGPNEVRVEALEFKRWRAVIDTNLSGVFLMTKAAIAGLRRSGAGSIINFSSGTVRFPEPGLSAYTSSKFAVEGFTKVLAQELASDGIRVNCLQPGGLVDTALIPSWYSPDERPSWHRPSVIRSSAVYLASDESRWITGRSLVATYWNKEHDIVDCPCATCNTRDCALAIEWRGVTAL